MKSLLLKSKEVSGLQTKGWSCMIDDVEVSIVKWNEGFYEDQYEIYSWDRLFEDVYRFKTLEAALEFLMNLK